MAGRVGDRLLLLKNRDDLGYPTMDIVKIQDVSTAGYTGNVRGKLTDKIIFVQH